MQRGAHCSAPLGTAVHHSALQCATRHCRGVGTSSVTDARAMLTPVHQCSVPHCRLQCSVPHCSALLVPCKLPLPVMLHLQRSQSTTPHYTALLDTPRASARPDQSIERGPWEGASGNHGMARGRWGDREVGDAKGLEHWNWDFFSRMMECTRKFNQYKVKSILEVLCSNCING